MQSPWFYSSLGVENASTHNALILFMVGITGSSPILSAPFSLLFLVNTNLKQMTLPNSKVTYKALISALVNMYRDNASTLTPDPIHSNVL